MSKRQGKVDFLGWAFLFFLVVMFVVPVTYNFVPTGVQAIYKLLFITAAALLAVFMLWSGGLSVLERWREDRNELGRGIVRLLKYLALGIIFVLAGMHVTYLLDTKWYITQPDPRFTAQEHASYGRDEKRLASFKCTVVGYWYGNMYQDR
jgi:TRAP-type C4-dicarboxylate transport system permease small subunit